MTIIDIISTGIFCIGFWMWIFHEDHLPNEPILKWGYPIMCSGFYMMVGCLLARLIEYLIV